MKRPRPEAEISTPLEAGASSSTPESQRTTKVLEDHSTGQNEDKDGAKPLESETSAADPPAKKPRRSLRVNEYNQPIELVALVQDKKKPLVVSHSANEGRHDDSHASNGSSPAHPLRALLTEEEAAELRERERRRQAAHDAVKSAMYTRVGSIETDRDLTDLLKDPQGLTFYPGTKVWNEVLEDLLSLTRENMKDLYDGSTAGWSAWSDTNKRGELREERMRWFLARSTTASDSATTTTTTKSEETSGEPAESGFPMTHSGLPPILGFVAFRFSHETDIPHVYIHELQVHRSARGSGLGKRLVSAATEVARASGMALMMLTVLSNNAPARGFYTHLGYETDEVSPTTCYSIDPSMSSHEILSRVLDESILRFACGECAFRARFPDTLEQHAARAHGKPWPFPCTVPGCGRGTALAHQLTRHLEMAHHLHAHSPTSDSRELKADSRELNADSRDLDVDSGPPDESAPEDISPPLTKQQRDKQANLTSKVLLNERVTLKDDGSRGMVVRVSDNGFCTVRFDGVDMHQVRFRHTKLVGFEPAPPKPKPKQDPDYEFALQLQLQDGFVRRSCRRRQPQ